MIAVPITVTEQNMSWADMSLANNDIIMDVQTPRRMHGVVCEHTERDRQAGERAFRSNTEISWDALFYFF
nr:hypothetical protein [uncultured Lichenicoccus sp.]